MAVVVLVKAGLVAGWGTEGADSAVVALGVLGWVEAAEDCSTAHSAVMITSAACLCAQQLHTMLGIGTMYSMP